MSTTVFLGSFRQTTAGSSVASAELGILEKRLPWIQNEGAPSLPFPENECDIDEFAHPTTNVTDRYSLSDRFHEKNSSQKRALLRRVTLVPEFNGIINTEAEEQLHSLIDRFNYCLNTMRPVNHLFMMHLKVHLHNSGINRTFRANIESTFSAQAGHAVETEFDNYGRLLLRLTGDEPPLSPIIPVSANCRNRSSSSTGTASGEDHNASTKTSSSIPSTAPTRNDPSMNKQTTSALKKSKVRYVKVIALYYIAPPYCAEFYA